MHSRKSYAIMQLDYGGGSFCRPHSLVLKMQENGMAKIEKLVESIAEPIARERGLRVYDVEYKKEGPDWFLRVYLYGENGVDLTDCEYVSRALEKVLDEEDPIETAYCLEVSSPGLERILSRDWHFEAAIGEKTELRFYAPVDGSKSLQGILRAYDKEYITIETESGEECRFETGQVAKAHTVFDGKF